MATLAAPHRTFAKDDRFFLTTAIAMAVIIFAGFSLSLGMGHSTFDAPPIVHAHALVFMGWVVLYVTQTALVTRGSIALHRRLGWIGAGWVVAMVALGTIVTVRLARLGQVPFFFTPLLFTVMDPLTVLTFAGLITAGIVCRRQTQWHRRLNYCGMAMLLGPAYGRLLPMPLFIPYAYEILSPLLLLFPAIGIAVDLRRSGRVHPTWWWGVGTIIGSTLLGEAIIHSPVGGAIYRGVTAGSPGAAIAPLGYPPFPAGPPAAHP